VWAIDAARRWASKAASKEEVEAAFNAALDASHYVPQIFIGEAYAIDAAVEAAFDVVGPLVGGRDSTYNKMYERRMFAPISVLRTCADIVRRYITWADIEKGLNRL
jgi:hypothetical protein